MAAPSTALETLVGRYSGNPLALKLVADTVRDLFGADVNAFLSGETPVFDDIRSVLDDQYDRLERCAAGNHHLVGHRTTARADP